MPETTSNRNIEAAWNYHNATKHSWNSIHTSNHRLDFSNQPSPFKIYPELKGERLPTDLVSSEMPALSSLTAPQTSPDKDAGAVALSLKHLAGLLYYSAGITKRGIVPGGQIFFRAAACTGALYHIELYLVCGGIHGLEDGVYHFGPHDFSLRQLRKGDYRAVLIEATGNEPSVAGAPAILVTSSVYWRNAWKYQSRAYRHSYWDSGTILSNLTAMGRAYDLPLKIVTAFADDPVNHLLGLDVSRESALHLVPVGSGSAGALGPPPEIRELELQVAPYSAWEVEYPQIEGIHRATSLRSAREASELRKVALEGVAAEPEGRTVSLDRLPEEELPNESIEPVIVRRGSSRRFRRDPITYRQLSTVLEMAEQDLPTDFIGIPGARLTQPYLIVNNVTDLEPGTYVYHSSMQALEQLREGEFRQEAGYLGLQQELPADASVNIYFFSDLKRVLELYGNRGFRMAQTEAAMRAGKVYMAAYALRLGASGLTFFDDDVTEFFSPHAAGKSVMFLVALGRPRPRRRTSG